MSDPVDRSVSAAGGSTFVQALTPAAQPPALDLQSSATRRAPVIRRGSPAEPGSAGKRPGQDREHRSEGGPPPSPTSRQAAVWRRDAAQARPVAVRCDRGYGQRVAFLRSDLRVAARLEHRLQSLHARPAQRALAQFVERCEHVRLHDAEPTSCMPCRMVDPRLYPYRSDSIAVSQEDLAHLAGVSRSIVSRVLHKLEREGLVRVDYRSIRLLDPNGLRRFSAVGSSH